MAVFVQLDEFNDFQNTMDYILRKHGEKYEKLSWNIIDDGSVDLIQDDLCGLLDSDDISDSEE